jgi:hypothetical protein
VVNITPADSTSFRGVTRGLLTPKDQYIAQRARGAYIASICQPEASFDLSFAAQVINPVKDNRKNLAEWNCLQLLINKLFIACQGVPVKAYNSIGVG